MPPQPGGPTGSPRPSAAEPGQPSRSAGPTPAGLTALLGALTAFGPLSIDMYLPALPALADSFAVDPSRVQLTLSAFFLGFGAGQLVYGPLSDRWGRRPPLLIGGGVYVLASIACALAPRVEWLIGLRLLQGLGACGGPLSARAVVRDLHERDRAARMLSLLMLVMGAAPLLAPLVGGQLLRAFGWRSIFVVLAAFGVLCLLGAGLGLPETLPPARRSRAGVREMIAAYGALLGHRAFVGYAVSSGAAYAGMFAYFAGSPFVFIRLHHVPAERYGLLFALNVLGLMACAAVNSRLVLVQGADRMLRQGVLAVAVAGLALFVTARTGWGGLPGLVVPIFVFMASLSFIGANATAGALAAFPHRAGTAAALAGTIQFGLGAGSAALVGTLHDGTATPMAVVIAVAGVTSLLVHRLVVRA
jgi:DHA1 family bicyclomycin/chloramphenicol resistance-like MFS transporter